MKTLRLLMMLCLIGLEAQAGLILLDQADDLKTSTVNYYTGTSMLYGRGYDTFRDDTVGKCITFEQTAYDNSHQTGTIQDATFKLELIESKHELAKKLGVSVSASLKSGWGKANATVDYVNEQKLNQYSLYVLVTAKILVPMERLKDEYLDSFYVDLATSNMMAFRKKCGNEYVGAIQRGGLFYGLLRMDTVDQSSYQKIKTTLVGKVGTFQATSGIRESLLRIQQEKEFKIFVHQVGGESKPFPTDIDELISRVKNFPEEVVKNPIPIFAVTSSYEDLKDFPLDATPFDTSLQESTLEYLNNLRTNITNLRNDVEYILANGYQFEVFDQDNFVTAINLTNKLLNDINLAAKVCILNFNNCKYPTDLKLPVVELPKRLMNVEVNSKCQLMSHKVCGEIYLEKVSSACEAKHYFQGRHESCGVELNKLARSEHCGVELYNHQQGPACGQATYRQGTNGNVCGFEEFEDCPKNNELLRGPIGRCFRRRVEKSCRHPHFGVESYPACRHESFGVERYKECRHPAHPIEMFKECEHPSFGISEYSSCRHVTHGVEGVKECHVKEVLDQGSQAPKFVLCEKTNSKDF